MNNLSLITVVFKTGNLQGKTVKINKSDFNPAKHFTKEEAMAFKKANIQAKAKAEAKAEAKAKAKAKAIEEAKAIEAIEDAKVKAKAIEDAKVKAKAIENAKVKAKAIEDVKVKNIENVTIKKYSPKNK